MRPEGRPPWRAAAAKVSPGARRLDGGRSAILVSGHACRRCFCTDEARTPPPSSQNQYSPGHPYGGAPPAPTGCSRSSPHTPRQTLKVIKRERSRSAFYCVIYTHAISFYFFCTVGAHLPLQSISAAHAQSDTANCSWYFLLLLLLFSLQFFKLRVSYIVKLCPVQELCKTKEILLVLD